MPYITIFTKPQDYQISFDDLLNGVNESLFNQKFENTHDTKTVFREVTPSKLKENINVGEMIAILNSFNERHADLINTTDKSVLYHSFKIPKRSGGLRPIDAPNEELMEALRELKHIFEQTLFAKYHTSAFAYVKGRCAIDAVKRHQKNNSRWFLKLDFHNFFGSTTLDFVIKMLKMIFPFSEILKTEAGYGVLKDALSLCFLNGGLPQGTPISPTITNLMMIPVDHAIAKMAREHSPHLCYTRYADDLLLSSDINFRWSEVQNSILQTLSQFEAPFSLNTEKTRYGSSAGRNWNLGVMLNKDNQITIGHQRKKTFKAMIFSFLSDHINGQQWNVSDVQYILGLYSYYTAVEKDCIDKIIKTYDAKFNLDTLSLIKSYLKV